MPKQLGPYLGIALLILLVVTVPPWIERHILLALGQTTAGPPPGMNLGLRSTSMEPVIVTSRHKSAYFRNVVNPEGDPTKQPWIRFSIPAAYFTEISGTTGVDGSASFGLGFWYDNMEPANLPPPPNVPMEVAWLLFPGAAYNPEGMQERLGVRILPLYRPAEAKSCEVTDDADLGLTRYKVVRDGQTSSKRLCSNELKYLPLAGEGFIKFKSDRTIKFSVVCSNGLRVGYPCELLGNLDIWQIVISIPNRDPASWDRTYDRIVLFLRSHIVNRSPQDLEF
jgi:hypothetical protein